ncbi:NmrA family NAD(P)-binding protein [Streptosporangium sandarakinum]|uniref:NmrA family NAD(P)-binding protein n=1 Tax=Streptosporangium sandarakinum TaxID=1260955 RepID=UPI00378EDE3C
MSVALVIGATGRQGGATARHLLSRGWQVRALVRDPESPAARRLAGTELTVGDLGDLASLERAVRGVDAVFSMQALAYEPETLKAEVRQGMLVADVALDAGHAQPPSPGRHLRSTIWRPVSRLFPTPPVRGDSSPGGRRSPSLRTSGRCPAGPRGGVMRDASGTGSPEEVRPCT